MTDIVNRPKQPRADRIRSAVESGRGPALMPTRILILVVIIAISMVLGLTGSSSLRYALAIGGIYSIAVLANGVVLGCLGEINLGSSAWMAVGSYTCAIASQHGLPLLLSIGLAAVVAMIGGIIVAIPTVRLRGIFTALVTFALAFAVPQVIVYLEKYTGGAGGKSLPDPLRLFGMEIGGSSYGMLILVDVVFVLVALASVALLESGVGKTAIWVGEAEAAAAAFGVRTMLLKVLVWTWSAALGGLAGALFALTVGFISPGQFASTLGISLFVGSVIAGSRSIWGAWIGGAIIGVIPPQLQNFIPASATGILFGVILLAAILTGSGGLARLFEWLFTQPVRRAAGDNQ